MDKLEARLIFAAWVARQGSLRAAAKTLGVTHSYVHDMRKGRRRLSEGALRKIGLRRVMKEVYESR